MSLTSNPRRRATLGGVALSVLFGCGGSSSSGAGLAVEPSTLPLLAAGQHVGIAYSTPTPAARAALDAAFGECIAAGVSTHELSFSWAELESSPGVLDTSTLTRTLVRTQTSGLASYLVIKTIDGSTLSLPADLVHADDPNELAAGLTFHHPAVLARLDALIDAVAPLLVLSGGFYLSVGDGVDGWLASRPEHLSGFAAFVTSARARARGHDARLAVGATLRFSSIVLADQVLSAVRTASDVVAFTYYPLKPDLAVRSPDVVAADLATMRQAAQPAPLVLQAIGYPSGWSGAPTNGSSPELQRQFVANVFAAIAQDPGIRYVSFRQLADWSRSEVTRLAETHAVTAPGLPEFLATLGLREHADGAAKPAYAQFLRGLSGM
ncbi:MAG: hypothetical protein AAF628_19665 [Planctomycetota bacterium]